MIGRRRFGRIVAVAFFLAATEARSEELTVPVSLQASLASKVAAYDRNFPTRAGDSAKILILTKKGDAASEHTGTQFQKALSELTDFAGLSHTETIANFTSAADLAASCKAKKYAVVYVTQGFDGDVAAIATSLKGMSVLTVSAIPGYVPKGIVLGFDTDSGKSKLLVNLAQAREQSVSFKSEMLNLMKVYE